MNGQKEFSLSTTSLTKKDYEMERQDGGYQVCTWILAFISFLFVLCSFPLSLFFCLKVVKDYERAIIFRNGRLRRGCSKGSGLFFVLPCIDSFTKVDLRVVCYDVPSQEILTRDSVTISVDAVAYFRIFNAIASSCNVLNASGSTKLLVQTSLRNELGTKSLSEILMEKETIRKNLEHTLDHATDSWGVKVERLEIKDVRLPNNMQRAMAAEAEASREARAKVIAAEGEMNASRALKEASDIISESPCAIQLRYLQTLQAVSAEKNSTIIFPLPIDFLSSFLKNV